MTRHRRGRGREILWFLGMFAVLLMFAAFGEFMTHILTFVFLALIPCAFIAGKRAERYRLTGKTHANADYGRGRIQDMDAVSRYPSDASADHLERSRLLHDPRSGTHPL